MTSSISSESAGLDLKNTLNVCIGHKPFPVCAQNCIDIMIAPVEFETNCDTYVVDDSPSWAAWWHPC